MRQYCYLTLLAVAVPNACAPSDLDPGIRTLGGSAITQAQIDSLLAHEMVALGIPGLSLAILNDGQVVFHRAMGITDIDSPAAVNDGTVFEAGSLTKPVFAYFAMRMVEKGVLELDTPLYRYIPIDELWNGWYEDIADDERHRRITARMVLGHTTGLPNWRWEDPNGSLDLKFDPGSRFSYSGEGYEMLADVLAHLVDVDLRGLNALFRREVAIPLGMNSASISHAEGLARRKANGHVSGEPSGKDWCCNGRDFMAAGGLHTEAFSYAMFLVAIMAGDGLSEAHIDEMLTAQIDVPSDAPVRVDDGVTGWGLGFAVRPSRYGPLNLHGGTNTGFRSAFLFQRNRGFGYVLFTNSDRGDELNVRLRELLVGAVSD